MTQVVVVEAGFGLRQTDPRVKLSLNSCARMHAQEQPRKPRRKNREHRKRSQLLELLKASRHGPDCKIIKLN